MPAIGAADVRAWLQQARVHQFAKNGLVFVPILTAHAFAASSLVAALIAFCAFCLAAASVYIINDLRDLAADRQHPTKRLRPLARGVISPKAGAIAAGMMLVAAVAVAAAVSLQLALVISAYVGLATLYTFWLKRQLFADVVTLALLYTLRVIGGAVAIQVEVSEWLLAFSVLIFTSLALMKRHTELAMRQSANVSDPIDRGYRIDDLNAIAMMAAAAGFNAVTVLALYVSSETVRQLYSHPWVLWFICPVMMYWLGRGAGSDP